jgi:hypothetical protein
MIVLVFSAVLSSVLFRLQSQMSVHAAEAMQDYFISSVPPTEWNKTYGGVNGESARSIRQTTDGGYIIAGVTLSFGAGGQDFWLVKTDPNGNVQWNKTYGSTGYEYATSVQQTTDGGYIIFGYIGNGPTDLWLVKTDSAGNMQWNKTYGGADWEEPGFDHSVQQTSDGGYVLVGYTASFGAGQEDVWLIKTDSSGNVQWSKTYGGVDDEIGRSVQQTSDGGYVIAGYKDLGSPNYADFWLIKTDSSGNVQWNKTYGGATVDTAFSVQQTSDGGYIITGQTYSFGAGDADFWLVKSDSAGNMQWSQTYGGAETTDFPFCVRQTSDQGYIIAGSTGPIGSGTEMDFMLVKTDSAGSMQWSQTYGGSGWEQAFSVRQTTDGGYIVAGESAGGDFWVIKLGAQRDIAVTNVVPSKNVVKRGDVINISVTVVNQGEYTETFNVTTYYDSNVIGTQTVVSLPKGASRTLTFIWNTTGVPLGTYTISAEASVVPGETDIADNTFTDGQVEVKLLELNDLTITGVVPVQVIWENQTAEGEAKALIVNKKTVVWVELYSTFSGTVWAPIKITYNFGSSNYIEQGPYGYGVPISPGWNRFYLPGGPRQTPWFSPWATYPLGLYWNQQGNDSNIKVTVDPYNQLTEADELNNEMVVSRKFVESDYLKILFVPVYFPDIGQTPFPLRYTRKLWRSWVTVDLVKPQADFLLATYPVADNRFSYNVMSPYPIHGIPPTSPRLLEDWLYSNVAVRLSDMATKLGYDRVAIVIKDIGQNWAGIAIGMLRQPENRVPVILTFEYLEREGLLAHEIGHTYYLWHPHDIGPEVYYAQRFWVEKRYYEDLVNTFMSYRPPPLWIDKGRFDSDAKKPLVNWPYYCTWRWNLLDQLSIGLDPDPEVIVLQGVVFKNGTLKSDGSWWHLLEGTPDLELGTAGNYSIVFLNQQYEVLGQLGFNVTFTYLLDMNGTLIEAETDSVPFQFKIPYVNGTTTIEIRNSTGHILVSRTISSHAPTVNVTFPNGGEVLALGSNYTITWEASDLDGDPLTYSVAYSQDGGENWIPLAIDITENSYTWETRYLQNGTNYLFKIVANDGINIGEDTSDNPFALLIHDVAVASIVPSSTVVKQGGTLSINVTVANDGDQTEVFNVTTYADQNTTIIGDEIIIGSQTVTLSSRNMTSFTLTWNTSGIPLGNYTMSAEASMLPGEFNTTDNMLIDGTVEITIFYTLSITATICGTTSPSPGDYTYKMGTVVNVRAIPHYEFDHWELDGVNIGSANPITITMDSDHILHAVFVVPPPYNVTIKTHCNTEGIDVSVSITMDGLPTGYDTPYTFTDLICIHTFTVPPYDANGHPFKQWNTGETSTTLTVSSGGTYTAYYEAPPPPPPSKPVGGIVISVDKLVLLAPYIGLASTIVVATVATAVYVKRVKHRKEKQ